MSRCFPFAPLGYARNCATNEALIVSIKLQEEWQKSIPGVVRKKVNDLDNKKDRKREKKDKNKVRKDKKTDVKDGFLSATQSEKHNFSNKSYKVDCTGKEFKVFEQSNLTEEHGRPVNSQKASRFSDSTENSCKRKWDSPPVYSQKASRFSDSTENSCKRKWDSPPVYSQKASRSSDSTENSCKREWDSPPASSIQGNIIRIRLYSMKRDDPNAMNSLPSQKSDWISKIQEPSICQNDVISKVWEPSHFDKKTASIEDPSSNGRVVNIKPPLKKLSSHEKRMLKKESLYKHLFNSLVPDRLVSSLEASKDGDDNWLFSKKDEEILAKRQRGMDNLSCSVSAIQPHARLLPNVGVYALPFTVPF
ncbi:uncharacterized protein LOC141605923 isoform X2 [Silene latifolia]|uniref:uncharacterized protein LOC141605923 isoform X2 n=1 Tax=Silene latifolia TaxID=37657 RepID=UPI003D784098